MNRLIGILLVGGKPGGAAVHQAGDLLHLVPPSPGRHRPGERPPLQGAARALPPDVAGRPAGDDRRAGRRRGPRDPQPADGHPVVPPVPGGQDRRRGDRRSCSRAALQETGRINEIVSALLAFSRPAEIVRERHDLRETLAESLDLVAFQAAVRKIVVLRRDLPTPLVRRTATGPSSNSFSSTSSSTPSRPWPSGGTLTVEALGETGEGPGRGRRHGRRHPRGEPGPDLRPVLHHQEGRHRAGPVHLLQHRQIPRRRHRSQQPAGAGDDDARPPPARA